MVGEVVEEVGLSRARRAGDGNDGNLVCQKKRNNGEDVRVGSKLEHRKGSREQEGPHGREGTGGDARGGEEGRGGRERGDVDVLHIKVVI